MLMGNPQDSLLDSWQKKLYPWHAPLQSPNRPYGVSFNISGIMSLEELVSLQLDHIKQHAEKVLENEISNAIVVLPSPSFGPLNREALFDAATMARFNMVSGVEEHEMAAKYLLADATGPSTHLLVDVGYSHVTVSVVVVGKPRPKSIEVIKSKSSFSIGALYFDLVVQKLIWEKFVNAHLDDLLQLESNIHWSNSTIDEITTQAFKCMNETAMNSLFGLFNVINEKASEAKELFSSISHARVEIFAPLPKIEVFSTIISKDEFVPKIEPTLSGIAELIKQLHVSLQDTCSIDDVFLLGGGTRMPSVVDYIKKALKSLNIKGKLIARNNEEAVILGSCEMTKAFHSAFETTELSKATCDENNHSSSTAVWPFSLFYILEDSDATTKLDDNYLPLVSAYDVTPLEISISLRACTSDFIIKFYIFSEGNYTQWSALYSLGITDHLIDTANNDPLDVEIYLHKMFSGLLEPSRIIGHSSNNRTDLKIAYHYVELFPQFSKDLIYDIEAKEDYAFHHDQAANDVISHVSNSLLALVLNIKRLFGERLTPKSSNVISFFHIDLLAFLSPNSKQLLKMRLDKVLADLDSDEDIPLLEKLTDQKVLKEILIQAIPRKKLYDTLQLVICNKAMPATKDRKAVVVKDPDYLYEIDDGNQCRPKEYIGKILQSTPYGNPSVNDLWVLFDIENSEEILSLIDKIKNLSLTMEHAHFHDVEKIHVHSRETDDPSRTRYQDLDEKTSYFIRSGLSLLYVLTTKTDPFLLTTERSLPQSFWNEDFIKWLRTTCR